MFQRDVVVGWKTQAGTRAANHRRHTHRRETQGTVTNTKNMEASLIHEPLMHEPLSYTCMSQRPPAKPTRSTPPCRALSPQQHHNVTESVNRLSGGHPLPVAPSAYSLYSCCLKRVRRTRWLSFAAAHQGPASPAGLFYLKQETSPPTNPELLYLTAPSCGRQAAHRSGQVLLHGSA